MKKIYAFAVVALTVALATSCGNKAGSPADADSLQVALANTQNDYQELKNFLSVIATGLDSINTQESDIVKTSQESPTPNQQRIKEQLAALNTQLQSQRARISQLEKKLKAGNEDAAMMKTVINMLKGQLEQKTARIQELQRELDSKTLTIQDLNFKVQNLTEQTTRQQATIDAQTDMLKTQDEMLNMGYVKIATKDELKAAGLLTGGFLKKTKVDIEKLDHHQFRTVDVRDDKEFDIPGKLKKVKVLTQMPEGSYTLEKVSDDKSKLRVLDVQKFWSVSNFLVIQTD